jgi:hypothetical protein
VALQHGDLACDGCGVWCDLDPVALLGRTPELYGLTDPAKVRELTYFWLCRDCSPEYPDGARDFFVESYFVADEPYCSECEVESVPEWGQTCGYCE